MIRPKPEPQPVLADAPHTHGVGLPVPESTDGYDRCRPLSDRRRDPVWSSAYSAYFLNRKNVIVIMMSIELILLAVNLNLVAFSLRAE